MKQIAIIGPTASGKTALAIEVAQKHNCYILSLDSLSIYKEVDIVSAKPTVEERAGIPHFGIDEIYVNEEFNVVKFFDIYKKAKEACEKDSKNLIIVGGSSFYLKAMMDGLSKSQKITHETKILVKEKTKDLSQAYSFIKKLDLEYAQKISKADRYRMEKWYEIFLSENQVATKFFLNNPQKPILKHLKIYEIKTDRDELRKKISLRTSLMLKQGLIDEIYFLEKKYGRNHIAMGSIGVKETLDFLDGKIKKEELKAQISTHTAQLAKRQTTFNRTQFPTKISNIKENLKKDISFYF